MSQDWTVWTRTVVWGFPIKVHSRGQHFLMWLLSRNPLTGIWMICCVVSKETRVDRHTHMCRKGVGRDETGNWNRRPCVEQSAAEPYIACENQTQKVRFTMFCHREIYFTVLGMSLDILSLYYLDFLKTVLVCLVCPRQFATATTSH